MCLFGAGSDKENGDIMRVMTGLEFIDQQLVDAFGDELVVCNTKLPEVKIRNVAPEEIKRLDQLMEDGLGPNDTLK